MTPSSISVPEYSTTAAKAPWEQTVKVKITAAADEDIDAETLMLDFVVNGTVGQTTGPGPAWTTAPGVRTTMGPWPWRP